MINKKLKIIVFFSMAVVILTVIGYHMGGKLTQQERLYMRNELNHMDARLRELGVNTCIIQPLEERSNRLFVMLSFWESDESEILNRKDQIKKIISDFAKMEGIRSPVISYLDENGYDLGDVLRAQADVGVDKTEAEYYSVVNRFSSVLEERLRNVFNRDVNPNDYQIKVIADAEYDVTLDTYGARKLYFFARFRDANTRQLQAVRIAYKRVSSFNVARGDKIYFYNHTPREYVLINGMKRLMDRQKKAEIRDRAVLFSPIRGAFEDAPPAATPQTTSTHEPAITPDSSPTATPMEEPVLTPVTTPMETPLGTPASTPEATPSPEDSTPVILGPPVPGEVPGTP